MVTAPRIGVFHPAQSPLEALVPTARAAEAWGFDSLWVAEDCFLAGGLTAAATVLARTESIAVGLGLLPAPPRSSSSPPRPTRWTSSSASPPRCCRCFNGQG
jgi:alkanesulfonate monooxygenase SsuD/methylene tetrahydromethanopterin reductase-like flavin-dependent oxidoreductase (luciferase family)